MDQPSSRRSFLRNVGLGTLGAVAAGGLFDTAAAQTPGKKILGEAGAATSARPKGVWKPVSDRKIRVGIVGYGACQFGPQFGFQDHPNVTVTAVSDLFPDRCRALAKACRCGKTYPSLEEMVKDDAIEAIFLATDAPSHARHAIDVLKHGKHVATAVPAVFGSLEDADKLLETVRSSGRKYMMFETSAFHEDCHAMRQIYQAGGFGKLVYSEGEYFHYMSTPIPSFREWRVGVPPQWYPTHSNAYYVCVTGGSFTEVTCLAMPSIIKELQPQNNRYKNPFGTEIALLRTSEGGMSRMVVCWERACPETEAGRVYGQFGSMVAGAYTGKRKLAQPRTSALAAPRRSRRARRLARPPYERVRHGDPRRPQAAGRYRHGPELDRGRRGGPSVGDEGRRDDEDTAVQECLVLRT